MSDVQKEIKDEVWKLIRNYLECIKIIDYDVVQNEMTELINNFNINNIIYDYWVVCNGENNHKYCLDQNIYVVDVYLQQYKDGQIVCLNTHLNMEKQLKNLEVE